MYHIFLSSFRFSHETQKTSLDGEKDSWGHDGVGGRGVGGPGLPPSHKKGNRHGGKCGVCCSRVTSLICSNVGVCLLVLLYTVAGAFLFTSIEGDHGGAGGDVIPEPTMQQVKEGKKSVVIGSTFSGHDAARRGSDHPTVRI